MHPSAHSLLSPPHRALRHRRCCAALASCCGVLVSLAACDNGSAVGAPDPGFVPKVFAVERASMMAEGPVTAADVSAMPSSQSTHDTNAATTTDTDHTDFTDREFSTTDERPAPLFDDNGRVLPSPRSAMPVDTAARTRSGRYASAGQLEWEELTVGLYSVVLDVDAAGSVEATLKRAHELRAWNDSSARVYYVRGRDTAGAAQVVNTLEDEGFGIVFLVH